jgi:hypothetical protein
LVDCVYDLVGKIQQVNDPTGTYAFAYDNIPAGYKYSPYPVRGAINWR